ncbi:MAG TPA: 3-deoxy-manno-octulosonate cytidylyltransferase, partial [Armatimonadota bacterium]|nr:3-deoxy-manno-octulosonate cytidylyltransferase [Armatimonadota bacterium]
SRAPIPYFRLDAGASQPDEPRRHPKSGLCPLKHIGLYVYRRETLLWFAGLPPSPLELTEGLEQLRALEAGCRIKVVQVQYSPIGVDTPEDLARVRAILEGRG